MQRLAGVVLRRMLIQRKYTFSTVWSGVEKCKECWSCLEMEKGELKFVIIIYQLFCRRQNSNDENH